LAQNPTPTLAQLVNELASLKGKTLFTFHSVGDVDGVNSALVLRDVAAKLSGAQCEARALDHVGGHAGKILRELGVSIQPAARFDQYSNIVLSDVSTRVLLGKRGDEFTAFPGRLVVIDHHKYNGALLQADFSYIDGAKSSSCEIVYQLMRLAGIRPTRTQAALLLTGILSDSALFRSADPFTFEAAGYLLKHCGIAYRDLIGLTFPIPDVSERMAAIKAAKTADVQKVGDLLVGVSESGAFELQCAALLVELGCDYAFVGNRKEGRISGAKNESLRGLEVGLIMERVGKVLQGAGGGHENVGGASGKNQLVPAGLAECVRAVKDHFGPASKSKR